MLHTDVVIAGGGVSGLAAAQSLQKFGRKFLLLERCPSMGGLTRTIEVGDFCFDYTGHFLHLRRYGSPAAIPFARLRDDEWDCIQRRSSCYAAGRMVQAPIQYHLGELPPDLLQACMHSYETRSRSGNGTRGSFSEYLVSNFGQAIADMFLVPLNEKTLSIPLERLSMNAVKRFFPIADESTIRRGASGDSSPIPGYNASFWYPRLGGIELLVQGLARGLDGCHLRQEICSVDLEQRITKTRGGLEIHWDRLLTSIPLREFARMTGESALIEAASQMTHSTTISINVGLRGEVSDPLRNQHWIYVPDRRIPFYRVGVYSNISEGVCAGGRSALYAEVGLPAHRLGEAHISTLQDQVINVLETLGWLDRRNIECVAVHVLKCAYVHHTPEAESSAQMILARLATAGVYPIGRYGRWDYTSMEDSIHDGISTVENILS